MAPLTQHEVVYGDKQKKIVYYEAGPSEGPLMIFVHGWPAIGKTWIYQLNAFAALGFRVVAPDMPGYGKSTANHVIEDYSLQAIDQGLLALLEHTGRDDAIWVCHDWGSGCVWSFASHYPEKCRAVCSISVPYRLIELGLEELLKYVNREMYPEDEYPWGQWGYQAFYEQSFEKATAWFDSDVRGILTMFFSRRDKAGFEKPAFSATTVKDGGWFGGPSKLPKPPSADSLPPSTKIVDEEVFEELVGAMEKTGFFPADAYYMNHKRNRAYCEVVPNNAVLEMPVLFIETRFDTICDTVNSRAAEPQRKLCKNLTETSVNTAHWGQLEKPEEVNAILARWLSQEVATSWPGYWKSPFVKNSRL